MRKIFLSRISGVKKTVRTGECDISAAASSEKRDERKDKGTHIARVENTAHSVPYRRFGFDCHIENNDDHDASHKDMPMEEISTIGSFSLSLFLGLAMMGLKLWQLAELALPMIVMLAAQTVLMAIFAYFVVFNLLGKNYDAAVMTSGFCGFGMGATPNAMANMQAITAKYGPAPTAYFVVPLVGSLFIDFFNALIITTFMNFL